MSHTFENQPCEVIVDDILIWTDNEQKHSESLQNSSKHCRKQRMFDYVSTSTKVNKSVAIFTKLRRRKHKRRTFVCITIGKVTLEPSAQLDSNREVKLIDDVFALLVSTTSQVNVCKVWVYVYVHVYEL
jgi:hypothetical protein